MIRSMCNLLPVRLVLCLLIFFGCFNILALRDTLSVAIVSMADKGVIPKHIGNLPAHDVILMSFYPLYILSSLMGGSLSARFGCKSVFGLGVFLTSVVTLFIPLAANHSYASLMAVRALQGLFEGVTIPAAYNVFGIWFPKSERTILRSLSESGIIVGVLAGNPIAGYLSATDILGGWPFVFYLFGGVAIIWCAFWWLLMYERPSEHPWISSKELNFILSDQGEETARKSPKTPWILILKSPAVWALIVCNFSWYLFTMFVRLDYPTYLHKIYNYQIQKIGWLTSLPQLIFLLVGLASGFLVDYLLARNPPHRRTTIRKCFNFAGSLSTVVLQICNILLAKNPETVVSLITLAYGLSALDNAGSLSVPIDLSPVFAGSVYGLRNAVDNLTGIISPFIIGAIVSGKESSREAWNIFFIVAIVANCLGAIVFLIFGSSDLQPWGLEGDTRTEARLNVELKEGTPCHRYQQNTHETTPSDN